MTAEQAAAINHDAESVDNSEAIIQQIRHAARQRKCSVEIGQSTMTDATHRQLRKLGYFISARRINSPTRRNWCRTEIVYTVSW